MDKNTSRTISVVLSEAEHKALAYVAVSPDEWASNMLKERARWAMIEIFEVESRRMLQDSSITQIPADIEAVVLAADIKSAADRNVEALQQLDM